MTEKAMTKIKLTCNILIRDNNLYIYIYIYIYIYSRKMIKIFKQLYSETLLNCCLFLFQCHADIDQVACVLLVGQSPQSIAGPGRRCCGTVMVGSFAVVV